MIVESRPDEDIAVNVCKKSTLPIPAPKLRHALRLTPPYGSVAGTVLEFINEDELVEVTPENIRLRKVILSKEQRMKQAAKRK